MSAIAGIYNRDGQTANRCDLGRMTDRLAHRGPDDTAIWCEGAVGLGHRMLWTTPESLHEKLPLADWTGNLVLTADARIDNRDALIPAFGFQHHRSDRISDSQLILAAYQKWGDRCPEYLLGDFAFAIWDARKQTLFCARDHFGVKPFYYYNSGRSFVFATEIKAILALPQIPRQLDEVRVGDYLISQFEDTERTFYRDIWRLPPAHRMTISADSIQLQAYWSLDPNRELHLASDEDYAAQFQELFAEAVGCRLRSSFSVGSMLSGGLDSSSIACMAQHLRAKNGGDPLPTFSAIFDEVSECDERLYINAVLAKGGFEPHYVYGDRLSPLTEIDRVLWHQDEPLYAFNLSLNWGLYGVAQKRGVRTILDGFDGDSTVSHGVGYLGELAQAGRWLTLLREVRGYTRNFDRSFWEWMWTYVWNYGCDPVISKYKPLRLGRRIGKKLLKQVSQNSHSSAGLPSWWTTLNPDFARRMGLGERRKGLGKALLASQKSQRAQHHYSLVRGVMPYTLEVMDKAAGAFGLDVRFPFWDKRLVEFCLSLPPEQKIHRGWTRMVMRRALGGILPPAIQWRGGKSNLGPNFDRGLQTFEQKRLETLLFQNPEPIAEYANIDALRQAYQHFLAGNDRGDDAMALWRGLTLALWLQHFETGSVPEQDLLSVV